MALPRHITDSLKGREDNHQLRVLKTQNNWVDFSSNDFFGLAKNQTLQKKIDSTKKEFIGSSGSRLLSGNTKYHEELELFLANIHAAKAALLFNSGYNSNLGLLSSVPQKGDTIILDEKVHASIKDGARLSFAKKISFKHNDPEDLNKKIIKAEGNVYVVVESLYSMDGDYCDVHSILKVCNQSGAFLIVDEAHTTGVFGNGAGWCVEQGVHEEVFARIVTFGKALGSFGAAVLGDQKLIDYLINFARPFIYTTALPLYNIIAIREGFELIKNSNLRNQLDQKVELYKSLMAGTSNSYIQMVICDDALEARKKERELQMSGIDVRAILSPTVPKGEEKLRVCLHAFNSTEEIRKLAAILNQAR